MVSRKLRKLSFAIPSEKMPTPHGMNTRDRPARTPGGKQPSGRAKLIQCAVWTHLRGHERKRGVDGLGSQIGAVERIMERDSVSHARKIGRR
jgi:hypothetical protein